MFQSEPFNFIDSDGIAKGLNPDLLSEILKDEEWAIQYVPGSWAECLERLENGEIDLMMSVAYSAERSEVMDYSLEPVAEIWGQLFISSSSRIENLTDLTGRRIGVMDRDINGVNFKKTVDKLGIKVEIVDFPTHYDVFTAVQRGMVVAGVTPQHFGLLHAGDYDLVASSIIFSPFSIFFTARKGQHQELLNSIDVYLAKWKRDRSSIYYDRLNYWLGYKVPEPTVPGWVWISFGLAVLVVLVLTFFTYILKNAVDHKTEKLQESEAQYRRFVDLANEGVLALDKDGTISFINPRMAEMLGYTSDELLDHNVEMILFAEDLPDHEAEQAKRTEGQSTSYERRMKCKDGTMRWCLVSATPHYDKGGLYDGSFGMVTDITDRKIAEQKLQLAHERFLTVLDGIDSTIYVADLESREILFMNRHMQELFGGDMTGQKCWKALRNSDRPCDYCRDVTLVDELGSPTGVQVREDRHPVTRRWNIYRERAIRWVDGRLVRVQLATDITKLKELEQEQMAYEKSLQQTHRLEAIGTLAGGIAHDFNNILSSVIGFTEIALDDELETDSPARESLENVLQAGLRAKDLVKRILQFSRQGNYDVQPVAIKETIAEVMAMVRATLPANIEVRQNLVAENDIILGSATQVHQILMNLCGNAGYAMMEKGGQLEVALANIEVDEDFMHKLPDLKHGQYLELEIRDTGPGMGSEMLERIFDPFFTTKPKEEGTGLGLSVTHGIVKELEGVITVQSEKGEGTTFKVYLPTISSMPGDKKVQKTKQYAGNESILIVDDEQSIVNLVSAMLQKLGYVTHFAGDGQKALEMFAENPDGYDLVITDQAMPEMTGESLATELLEMRADLPIILQTGYSYVIDETKAKNLGIKAFVLKPAVGSELIKTIRKLLDEQSGRI